MTIKDSERHLLMTGKCKVAYRRWGKEGKPLVLLHGIPMNSSLWINTGNALAEAIIKWDKS